LKEALDYSAEAAPKPEAYSAFPTRRKPLGLRSLRAAAKAGPEEFILGEATPAPLEKLQGQFRFHILIRGEAILRLSRLVRETLDKLPFPEDVTVTVDVDPYQLL
jgi:primosomal protein N'